MSRALRVAFLALLLAGCAAAPAPTSSTPGSPEGSTVSTPAAPSGTSPAAPTPSPQAEPAPWRGVAFSPATMDGPGITAFFQEASQVGNAVAWGGDWMDLAKAGSGADVVATLGAKAGLRVVIEATFFQQRDGALLRPLDAANRTAYRDAAVAFVRAHHVAALALGIEVDILHERNASAFDAYAAWYPEVYDAVKAASPETLVFPLFQHERLDGHRGGLFGEDATSALPAWDLLARFPKRDLDAFTTYPGLFYDDPARIPGDLYANLTAHATKPIAFTETGWPASPDPAAQAAYVRWFASHAPAARATIWLALHDPAAPAPFASMGLVDATGAHRPAFDAWRAAWGLTSS